MRSDLGRAILLRILVLSALTHGCAQVEAPSGGPEDRSLPRVVGIEPDSGATGVRPDTIRILFGKEMDRASVRDWTFVTPELAVEKRVWTGRRLDLILAVPPDSGRTYAVFFGSEAVDRRKNPLGPKAYPFATGSRLDDGAVEGKVISGKLRTGGAYLFAWQWADSFGADAESLPPALRVTQASKDGRFRMENLPREVDFRIGAFYDAARNRSYEPDDDLWGFADGPIRLGDTTAVLSAIEIYLVLDDEPGVMAGAAVDSSCVRSGKGPLQSIRRESDSLLVALGRKGAGPASGLTDSLRGFAADAATPIDTIAALARLAALDSLRNEAEIDSARCATAVVVRLLDAAHDLPPDSSLVATVRGSGPFEFRDLPPGSYSVEAFRDLDGDGLAGEGEPRGAIPAPVTLLPGRRVEGLDFSLLPLPSNR